MDGNSTRPVSVDATSSTTIMRKAKFKVRRQSSSIDSSPVGSRRAKLCLLHNQDHRSAFGKSARVNLGVGRCLQCCVGIITQSEAYVLIERKLVLASIAMHAPNMPSSAMSDLDLAIRILERGVDSSWYARVALVSG